MSFLTPSITPTPAIITVTGIPSRVTTHPDPAKHAVHFDKLIIAVDKDAMPRKLACRIDATLMGNQWIATSCITFIASKEGADHSPGEGQASSETMQDGNALKSAANATNQATEHTISESTPVQRQSPTQPQATKTFSNPFSRASSGAQPAPRTPFQQANRPQERGGAKSKPAAPFNPDEDISFDPVY